MIDWTDFFELFELEGELATNVGRGIAKEAKEAGLDFPVSSEPGRRLVTVDQRLRELENRYERMRLVNAALWQLLKAHTGLMDADLKQYIEKVDLADGKLDGKIDRKGRAMDCPHCSRRILKSAVICPWCTKRLRAGDAFEAT